MERDGRPVARLALIVIEAPNKYGAQTSIVVDIQPCTNRFRLAALLNQPTGSTQAFNADVVATAKRDLSAGESLDGEGGFTVYGTLLPAQTSLAERGLPIDSRTVLR